MTDEACAAWMNSAAWKVQPGQMGRTWYRDGRWWTMRAQRGGMGTCRRGGARITEAVRDACAWEKGREVRGYGLPWHGSTRPWVVPVCRGGRSDYGGAMGSNVRGTWWLQVHNTDGMGKDGRQWRGLVGHRCGTARHEEGVGGDLEHVSPPRDCGEISSIQVVDRLLNGQPYSALSAPGHCLLF